MKAQKIVLASNNQGKLNEFKQLFVSYPQFEIQAQNAFQLDSVDETGLTFIENALLKARHACLHTNLPAIADDSGLCVDALDGRPGIFSSRFAGESATDHENNEKLLTEMATIPDAKRTARFCCVLVFLKHAYDPLPLITQGIWEGKIMTKPNGTSGFGYDPIFYVPTHHQSAAQLPKEIKNQLSHRGQAMRKLVEMLSNIVNPI